MTSAKRGNVISSRAPHRHLPVIVVIAGLALLGVGCQPGSPSLITTARIQTAVGPYTYSATAPLWQLHVENRDLDGPPIGDHFGLFLEDPLAGTGYGLLGGTPPPGAYSLRLALSSLGGPITVGTYPLFTGEATLEVNVATWDNAWYRLQSPPVEYEQRWDCGTMTAADGTVTVTQVTHSGDLITSLALSWDVTCPSLIRNVDGDLVPGDTHHWVGSAAYQG